MDRAHVITADDIQPVYGPERIRFETQSLDIDLNGDGLPERLVLLSDERRGLHLPNDAAAMTGGVVVDGFAVFEGQPPHIPVIYQYPDYSGYQLRLDVIDGRRVLVSDGGRDHTQHVWGWWRHEEDGPAEEWEARSRSLAEDKRAYGQWVRQRPISVNVGK